MKGLIPLVLHFTGVSSQSIRKPHTRSEFPPHTGGNVLEAVFWPRISSWDEETELCDPAPFSDCGNSKASVGPQIPQGSLGLRKPWGLSWVSVRWAASAWQDAPGTKDTKGRKETPRQYKDGMRMQQIVYISVRNFGVGQTSTMCSWGGVSQEPFRPRSLGLLGLGMG